MDTIESLMKRLAEHPDRPARVLHALTGLLRITDKDLAEMTGWSRPTAHGKRTGATPIKPTDLPLLAFALGFDMEVFFLETGDAIKRAVDDKPELFEVGEVTGALAA